MTAADVPTTDVPSASPTIVSVITTILCPQCGNFWGTGSLFVRDRCGHKKCRGCVIVEGDECGTCSQQTKAGNGCQEEKPPLLPETSSATNQLQSERGLSQSQGTKATKASPDYTCEVPTALPPTCKLESSNTQINDTEALSKSVRSSCSNDEKNNGQHSVEKKVLDELNVVNAGNVSVHLSEEKSEAVDDRDYEPGNGKTNIKRRPPPPHGVVKLPGFPVTYHCKICNRKFKSRSTIRYHYYCGSENKPLVCELCNKSFVSKSHLQYHMWAHSGELPFTCDICGKGFKQKAKLKRHNIVHTNDRKFECVKCGKRFAEASALRVHSRLHTGELPYQCEHCGRSFNENSNYQKHVRSIHTHERPFACETCGKCFTRAEYLKVHLSRHKGIRPHECSVCSLTFTHKKDLLRHIPVHDPSSHPFECNECSMTFKRKDNLVRHIKLTHNENEKCGGLDEVETAGGATADFKDPKDAETESDQAGDKSATAPEKETTAAAAALKTSNSRKEVEDTTECPDEVTLTAIQESSTACISVVGRQAEIQTTLAEGEVTLPVSASAAVESAFDENCNRPLRKRRVRLPPDPTACSSYPLFRRNVTPPPGALPEPPKVPRHCLPTPRDRNAVRCTPKPVDVLKKGREKKPPGSRSSTRKRRQKAVISDTTDIEKVGFIQVPQYPPKLRARIEKPRPTITEPTKIRATSTDTAQSTTTVTSTIAAHSAVRTTSTVTDMKTAILKDVKMPSIINSSKTAETCGAVPVIKRPQPSNCVRTITKTPKQNVPTIVTPRIRRLLPKPAPLLPLLPASSPKPDQPMLHMLLHDTPCSKTPQPAPPQKKCKYAPSSSSPNSTSTIPNPVEDLGLFYAYEYLLNSNLGQPIRRHPTASGQQAIPQKQFIGFEELSELQKQPSVVHQQPPLSQKQPSILHKETPFPQKQPSAIHQKTLFLHKNFSLVPKEQFPTQQEYCGQEKQLLTLQEPYPIVDEQLFIPQKQLSLFDNQPLLSENPPPLSQMELPLRHSSYSQKPGNLQQFQQQQQQHEETQKSLCSASPNQAQQTLQFPSMVKGFQKRLPECELLPSPHIDEFRTYCSYTPSTLTKKQVLFCGNKTAVF